MTRLLVGTLGVSALAASMALAEPSEPEQGDGRFTFHRADDGYLRLDSRTGQVSQCTRRSSGWQCQLTPDERGALEAEIARLQGENVTLKKELLSRNLQLPNGTRPEPPASIPDGPAAKSRTEAEVNRFMQFVEQVWRRVVDLVASVQDMIKRI